MGIHLHLVDVRSPRGFSVIPSDHLSAFRRIDIAAADTMDTVATRILHDCGNDPRNRYPLDVIRIEAHGTNAAGDYSVYASAQSKGSATLTHFANSTANKTYAYVIVG